MVVLKPTFNNFGPLTVVLPQSGPRSTKGQGLDMDLGLQIRDKGMSSKNAFKQETPQNFTPKYVEELVEEVLGSNKTAEMFQAMQWLVRRWIIWVQK